MANERIQAKTQLADMIQREFPEDETRRVVWLHWLDVATRTDRCPPHNFDAAFVSDEKGGAIYCRYCGLVLPLEVELVEAPAEERIETPADVHPPK